MWTPRLLTRAPTVLKAEAEQVRLPHTLNARRLPSAGGPAATTSGVSATSGPAEGTGGAPYARVAAARLRNQSNDSAAERCDGGEGSGAAIANAAAGCSETAC